MKRNRGNRTGRREELEGSSTSGREGELGEWELKQGAWLKVDYRGRLNAKRRKKGWRASRRELEQEMGKRRERMKTIGREKRTKKYAMQHVDQRPLRMVS